MLSTEDDTAELIKGGALIRQAFGINPYQLSDDEFVNRLSEALWLKNFERDLIESAMMRCLEKAFGEKGA